MINPALTNIFIHYDEVVYISVSTSTSGWKQLDNDYRLWMDGQNSSQQQYAYTNENVTNVFVSNELALHSWKVKNWGKRAPLIFQLFSPPPLRESLPTRLEPKQQLRALLAWDQCFLGLRPTDLTCAATSVFHSISFQRARRPAPSQAKRNALERDCISFLYLRVKSSWCNLNHSHSAPVHSHVH